MERWLNHRRGEGDTGTRAVGWERGDRAPCLATPPHLPCLLQRGPAGPAVPSLTH